MLVRQKIGRYAGLVFDMPILQAIANMRSGSIEYAEPLPQTAVDRLEEAGLLEPTVKTEAETEALLPPRQIRPILRRPPGRPRNTVQTG